MTIEDRYEVDLDIREELLSLGATLSALAEGGELSEGAALEIEEADVWLSGLEHAVASLRRELERLNETRAGAAFAAWERLGAMI